MYLIRDKYWTLTYSIRSLIIKFYNYSTYVFNIFCMFVCLFVCLFVCIVYLFSMLFIPCFCIVLCNFLLLFIAAHLLFFVEVYRPLLTGGNLIAVNKYIIYHIIYSYFCARVPTSVGIWHSEEHASWCILLIKAHKIHYFSNLFW